MYSFFINRIEEENYKDFIWSMLVKGNSEL